MHGSVFPKGWSTLLDLLCRFGVTHYCHIVRCQKLAEHFSFHMKYLDLHLKENLMRQTSFFRKRHLQKPISFRVKIHKNCLSLTLPVKATCFTQYLSYLNTEGEDSSCNIPISIFIDFAIFAPPRLLEMSVHL